MFDFVLDGLCLNIVLEDDGKLFWVLCMKVCDCIVVDGIDDLSFDVSNVGDYLKVVDVNVMLDDFDVVFIDMCNYYEYEVGYFENVLEILVDMFCEQLLKVVEMLWEYVDKKIVMYCIGGICCEKVSVWMKYNGFNKVWYIEGGIIEYVCCVCEQGFFVCFIGKNFVFDE